MKSYEEMTRCILAARDEQLRRKRKQRTVLLCCLPVLCCAAAVFGIGRYLNWKPETVQRSELPAATATAPESTVPAETTAQAAAGAAASQEPEPGGVPDAVPEQTLTDVQPETVPPQTEESAATDVPQEAVQTEPPAETAVPQRTEQTTETTVADRDLSGCPDTHEYRPWDELPVNEQYFGADIGKVPAENPTDTVYYQTAKSDVPEFEIGEYIGEAFMSGYDFYDPAADRYYHCRAKAYCVKGREQDSAVAVQFEDGGRYYLYVREVQGRITDADGLTG